MSDADIMWEAYQEEVQEWNVSRTLTELKLLKQDLDRGDLDTTAYNRSKIILDEHISDMINNHDSDIAYERAMKGI